MPCKQSVKGGQYTGSGLGFFLKSKRFFSRVPLQLRSRSGVDFPILKPSSLKSNLGCY